MPSPCKPCIQLVVISALALLSACGAPVTRSTAVDSAAMEHEAEIQKEIALQSQKQFHQQLSDTAYLIFTRSAPLCDNKKPGLGITAANLFSFSEEMRAAAKKFYGIDKQLQILLLARNSSAEKAGLKNGDRILSVNGTPVPADKNALTTFKEQVKSLDKTATYPVPVTLRIRRNNTERLVRIQAEAACDYGYGLASDDSINAFADGNNVFVTTGMMRFIESDNDLALVVSHELAHNVMGHLDKKKRNYMLGSIFDLIAAGYGINTQGTFGSIGAQQYSQEFEAEADYVGLYMMALSGLSYDNSHYFWRRMAAANPGGIKANHASSHPSTPQRFLALEKTVQEIKRKQMLKQPLRPELKATDNP